MHDKTRDNPRFMHSLDCWRQISEKEPMGNLYEGYESFVYKWTPYYAIMAIGIYMNLK